MSNNGLIYTVYNGYFNDNVNYFDNNTNYRISGTGNLTGSVNNISSISTGTNGYVPYDSSWDYYSVQWLGYFLPDITGTWTFWTESDDASYLWIGPHALSDYTKFNCTVYNGNIHGMEERGNTIQLIAGTSYPIRIQFGENTVDDDMIISFRGPSGSVASSKTSNGNGFYFNQIPTISNFSIFPKTYGDASFTITDPISNSIGSFVYISSNTSVATVNGNTITVVGSGNSTISAIQTASSNYATGLITTTFQVNKASQTITFNTLDSKVYSLNEVINLSATSSSGLPISYTSSNTDVVEVSGSTLIIKDVGTSIITASQIGDNNYNAAPLVKQTQEITKASQTITFNTLDSKVYSLNEVINLSATSSSGLPISYTSSNTDVVEVSGSTLIIKGGGTSIITASQIGNDDYEPTYTRQTQIITKASQTIIFDDSSYTFNDSTYTLNVTSSSGLPVSYVSSNSNIASINGNQLTFSGNGQVFVTVSQPGDNNFNPAPYVGKKFMRNMMVNTNYEYPIQVITNTNSIITNSGDSIIITIQNSNFTKTTGIAYIVDSPYYGSVAFINIKVFDTSNNPITDFSNEPLIIKLYLPQAIPTTTLLMYKLNTNTKTKMSPQPNGYPITLQYHSGYLWTVALPSLSSYLIQDVNPQIENNNLICFNKGSKILCLKNNSEIYEPIENLKNGDLIKTVNNGFKPIVMIGRSFMFNKAEDKRIKDQLYICKKEDYPELIEDLIITGRHSILVDYLTDKEKEETLRYFKNIYVTDNKYRLMAYIDERTKVYQMQGYHTIYHLALENDNYYGNYGIYANGLLVESCSKRTLRELSKMTLI